MADLLVLDIEKLKQKAKSKDKTASGNTKACIIRARYKLKVLEKYGFKCCNCGKKEELTIDHNEYKPRNRSTSGYHPEGCIILCKRCHIYKHEEYRKGRIPVTRKERGVQKL